MWRKNGDEENLQSGTEIFNRHQIYEGTPQFLRDEPLSVIGYINWSFIILIVFHVISSTFPLPLIVFWSAICMINMTAKTRQDFWPKNR